MTTLPERLHLAQRLADLKDRLGADGDECGACDLLTEAAQALQAEPEGGEVCIVCDCEGWRPDRTCAGLALLARAETAEAALLAKSAEYDALVALPATWRAWRNDPDHPVEGCASDERAAEIFDRCADELERLLLVREGGDG